MSEDDFELLDWAKEQKARIERVKKSKGSAQGLARVDTTSMKELLAKAHSHAHAIVSSEKAHEMEITDEHRNEIRNQKGTHHLRGRRMSAVKRHMLERGAEGVADRKSSGSKIGDIASHLQSLAENPAN
jgi:hypothetical protein